MAFFLFVSCWFISILSIYMLVSFICRVLTLMLFNLEGGLAVELLPIRLGHLGRHHSSNATCLTRPQSFSTVLLV